jgi:hypothetical protein
VSNFDKIRGQARETNTCPCRISSAYRQRIWEIELERMSEGATASDPNDIWNESIRILNAAKKQLLEY